MNKTQLIKRLVIGSANFTQKYGADPIKLNHKENKKILKLAKNNGIYEIDTAKTYLKSKDIFLDMDKKFKFSTKIIPNSKWMSLEFCQKQLEDHFKSFSTNKIETLLFHDIKILFTKRGMKIFKNLEVLKKKKYFKKIGLSIYDTSCLNYLNSNYT